MHHKIIQLLRDNSRFILLLTLMFVFRSSIADWNSVPTGSMKPTIVEGDRIWVNKMAYDLRVPFTHISLLHLADPQRGDIVVFDSKVSDMRLVKRVIGVPGDTIQLNNNILTINGKQLSYQPLSANSASIDRLENLLGIKHSIRIHPAGSSLSSFKPVTIPKNYYLMMGDNRDNSADSRVIGLVPREEVVGRSRYVVMSLDYNHYYLPRKNRFFQRL